MTKKRRYIKRKRKRVLIALCKRIIAITLIIGFILFFMIVLVENIFLKKEVVLAYQRYEDYKKINDEIVIDYNLSCYLIEEELNYEIYKVTGYSANDLKDQGTTNTTSIRFRCNAQYMNYINIVAIDPEVIPYGSFVFIKAIWEKDRPKYERMFIAGDCGGEIIGQELDVFFKTKKEATNFGVQVCQVRVILNKEN